MFGAKQRSYWFVAIAITLLMILGGCGSQPTSAPEPTQASAPADTPAAAGAPTDTAVPAEAPAKEPITIVFSNIAETGTLDPAIAFSSDGLEFVRNVYEGLLDYAPGTTDLRGWPGLYVQVA
jgi:ABC-type transport system substrate-binding protein